MGQGVDGGKMDLDTLVLLEMINDCQEQDIEKFKESLPDISKQDFEIMTDIKKLLLTALSRFDEAKIRSIKELSGNFLVGFHDINNLLFLLEILRNPSLD